MENVFWLVESAMLVEKIFTIPSEFKIFVWQLCLNFVVINKLDD